MLKLFGQLTLQREMHCWRRWQCNSKSGLRSGNSKTSICTNKEPGFELLSLSKLNLLSCQHYEPQYIAVNDNIFPLGVLFQFCQNVEIFQIFCLLLFLPLRKLFSDMLLISIFFLFFPLLRKPMVLSLGRFFISKIIFFIWPRTKGQSQIRSTSWPNRFKPISYAD